MDDHEQPEHIGARDELQKGQANSAAKAKRSQPTPSATKTDLPHVPYASEKTSKKNAVSGRNRSFSPVDTKARSSFFTNDNRQSRARGSAEHHQLPTAAARKASGNIENLESTTDLHTTTPGTRPPRQSMQLRHRASRGARSPKEYRTRARQSQSGPQAPPVRNIRGSSGSMVSHAAPRDSMEAAAASQLPFRPQRQLTRALTRMAMRSPPPVPAHAYGAASTPPALVDVNDSDEVGCGPADSPQPHALELPSAAAAEAGTAFDLAADAAVEHCDDEYALALDDADQFGRLLHKTASYSLHLVRGSVLARNVPIWHLQRPVCHQRVAEIKHTLQQRGTDPWLPGVISCFQLLEASGKLRRRVSVATAQSHGVIDGQHRVLACRELLRDSGIDCFLLVQVFHVAHAADVKDLFLELNKAETVQEVDLPDALAPPARRTIQQAVAVLEADFAPMFKPSVRCRPPHVNAAVLRDAVFRSRLQQLGKVGSSKTHLVAILRAANSRLDQAAETFWPPRLRGAPLAKARKFGFFLGLDVTRAMQMAEEI